DLAASGHHELPTGELAAIDVSGEVGVHAGELTGVKADLRWVGGGGDRGAHRRTLRPALPRPARGRTVRGAVTVRPPPAARRRRDVPGSTAVSVLNGQSRRR